MMVLDFDGESLKILILILSFLFSNGLLMAGPKTVTLATLEWPPYIGKSLPKDGYVAEIVVEAFKRSGYQTDIQFFPWPRAVHMVETGNRDGLFPEYFSVDREKKCVFSHPFPGGPVGFYKRKDARISFNGNPQKELKKVLHGLRQYRFGVVRGYINIAEFDAATYLIKDEADSDESNIKKLHVKRIDLIFIDKLVANYIIKTKHFEMTPDLEFMEPALEQKSLHICFSKKSADYQRKLKAFNKGLKSIKADGTINRIMSKHKSAWIN